MLGDSLATWKEGVLPLRSSNRSNTSSSQENQAVWLGWNNRIAGPDTTRVGPPGRFSLTLPHDLARRWGVGEATTLDLMLGGTNAIPEPRPDPARDSADANRDREHRGPGDRGERDADEEKPPIDLTVQVEDGEGRLAAVALSRYGPVRRPLETYVMRRRDQESQRFADHWEQVLQTYSIPLGDFQDANSSLDLRSLRAVRLVFDRSQAGEVVVDQIGFSDLDPAFLSARVEK